MDYRSFFYSKDFNTEKKEPEEIEQQEEQEKQATETVEVVETQQVTHSHKPPYPPLYPEIKNPVEEIRFKKEREGNYLNVTFKMSEDEFIAVVCALRVASNFSKLMDDIAQDKVNKRTDLLDVGNVDEIIEALHKLEKDKGVI